MAVAACGIFNYGMQTLRCSIWDLHIWTVMEPRPPALRVWCLSHWTSSEIPNFKFFKNFNTIFHSDCTNLHPQQQYTRVPYSLHPCWQLIFPVLLLIANMYKIISHHGFDFHFPALEHLFMYLVAISISSVEKCVFKESVNLKLIGFFCCWVVWVFCNIFWVLVHYDIYDLQLFYPI